MLARPHHGESASSDLRRIASAFHVPSSRLSRKHGPIVDAAFIHIRFQHAKDLSTIPWMNMTG